MIWTDCENRPRHEADEKGIGELQVSCIMEAEFRYHRRAMEGWSWYLREELKIKRLFLLEDDVFWRAALVSPHFTPISVIGVLQRKPCPLLTSLHFPRNPCFSHPWLLAVSAMSLTPSICTCSSAWTCLLSSVWLSNFYPSSGTEHSEMRVNT